MKQSNLSRIFKALSSEQRLKLFQMIHASCLEKKKKGKRSGSSCCEGLQKAFSLACGCMNLSRSTISHHFKELESAGLISCRRIGQAFSCSVNSEAIKKIQDFLK